MAPKDADPRDLSPIGPTPSPRSAKRRAGGADRRVVVIGAGAAGLGAALTLATAGCETIVLERAATPGGKMRSVAAGDVFVEGGPTVLTMRWAFDEMFEAAGARFDERVALERAEVLARHQWADAPSAAPFDLYADLDRSADAVAQFSGPDEARRFRAFHARAKRIYQALEKPFIAGERAGPAELIRRLGARTTLELMRLAPLGPLWGALGRVFKDPRLRQLYARYATYCGSSPFAAPGVLMLVAHVEQAGVWRARDGVSAVAHAIADLAAEHGAQFRYGVEVAEILAEGGRAVGVRLSTGEVVRADAVVSAVDVGALAEGRFGPTPAQAVGPTPRERRSLSAVVWTAKARASGVALSHHSVFFPTDYAAEFDAVFKRRRLPEAPTVYICAQDRNARAEPAFWPGPDGAERLHILVNAPADGDDPASIAPGGPLSEAEIEQCETRMIALLKRCGLDLVLEAATRTGPAEFEQLFPATGGALYGPANHGPFATFARQGGRTTLPGLELASGSVHPGPGVPMATLSGRLAAARILTDFASAPRLRPAAISGGISTG